MKNFLSTVLLTLVTTISAAFSQDYTEFTEATPIAEVISSAECQRIDFVMIGDSNQLFGGSGYDHGYQYALNQLYPMYASGMFSLGENRGAGGGVGYKSSVLSNASAGTFAYTGNSLWNPNQSIGLEFGTSYTAVGIAINADSPLQTNSGLRFHYKVSLADGGKFTPGLHIVNAPYSPLIRFNTVFAPKNETLLYNDSPAGYGNIGLHFRLGSAGITGPFVGRWARAENTSRSAGFSVHTWYGYGGQSARDVAEAMQSMPLGEMAAYLTDATGLQQSTSATVVRISLGLNDRNETVPSILNDYPGDSDDAYRENMIYILRRISDAWIFAEKNPNQLYFIVATPHAMSFPNDPELISYEDVLLDITQSVPNAFPVKLSSLADQTEMNLWYTNSYDKLHLKQIGYENLASREIQSLLGW